MEALMNSSRYPLYALAILVGGAIGLWAGISPFLLILLVLCPLMMFFMMRGGMHGDAHSGHGESGAPDDPKQGSQPTRSADLDGSHERIDRP
ncbi:DUF2933 domain-containing protein [Knoellia locipacati]|uniref:DUF2933 domain-containing protein n=1 Tax=Knoellia locipacati TaxID=882824 RepID=UPI00384F388E